MPRIPTYAGIRINAPQYSGPTGAEGLISLGQGLQDLAAGVNVYQRRKAAEAEAAQLQLNQDEARIYVAKSLSSLRERLTFEETELQNKMGPGAAGYTPEFMKLYDNFSEEIVQGAPNDLAKQAVTERLAELRGGFAEKALNYEAAAGQAQRENDVINSSRMYANYLRTHPSEFESILAEADVAIATLDNGSTSEDAEKLRWTVRNALATSAIEGALQVSPAIAEKKLKEGYWDPYITPDQKNGFLKSAESRKGQVSAVQRYQMQRMVENHLAAIEETGIGIPGVTAGAVAAAYGDEVAGLKFKDLERVSHKVHSARVELSSAGTPQQRAELIARYAPDRVNRPSTFAEDREVYQRLVTGLQQDTKLLQTDPAAWADRNGEISALAQSGGTVNAIETSLVSQQRGGVPFHATRVLTKEAAASLMQTLNAATPVEKIQALSGMEAEYGKYFPKVMTELRDAGLSADYMTIYNVQKTSPQVAGLLAEGMLVNKADIQDKFKASGRGAWSTVENSVAGQFNPLTQAATYAFPQRRGTMAATEDLFARTAANLVLSGRYSNVGDASKFLYENSFGSMYVDKSFYLPATTESGLPIDQDRVAADLHRLLTSADWVKNRRLETDVSAPMGSVSTGARQQVDAALIRSRGMWVNSKDGQSLELFIERPFGPARVYETVHGKGGHAFKRPVTVTLDQLANGELRQGFKFPDEKWTPPSFMEMLATPGAN